MHSHSFSALRFGATGCDARMVVDGDAVPLHPGDLLLTPAWCWHGHLHPGGDEPAVWFDGLDFPLVMALRAGFYREAPADWDTTPAQTANGAAAGVRYAPVDQPTRPHSSVRRYSWTEAYAALHREMARSDDRQGASIEYRNPITGGPALATIGCQLLGLPARGRSRAARETASSVSFVARGAGTALVDGHAHDLRTNDVVAIPAWAPHRFVARDEELVLFRMTDRPVHEALGLYRIETSP
jgi:gentisate 1,2-dioxygenase